MKILESVIVRVGVYETPCSKRPLILLEKESDLILNQFGRFLAALIRPVALATKDVTLQDTGNATRTVRVWAASGATFNLHGTIAGGFMCGVGSSSQAPARSDYNLISLLGSLQNAIDGVYESTTGIITTSSTIPLAAGGTVREVGFFLRCSDTANVQRTFILFRDVVADVVIAAGKNAFVEYAIQL